MPIRLYLRMDMEQISAISDFALVMGTAALVALAFNRLGLPLAPGYIISGLILSLISRTYGLIQSFSSIEVMSQLGMVLLLFTIGLQFSLRKLRKSGLLVIFIGSIEISISLTAGYWLGIIMGWTPIEAIALGGVLSISSTVIIIRSLQVATARWTPYIHLILGLLIVEDGVAIILITFYSSIHEGASLSILDSILIGMRMLLFVVIAIAIGLYLFPRLVDRVAALRNREVLVITILGLCFGMAAFSQILGFSTSMGAFVMGVIIGGSRSHKQINRSVRSIRDFFVALFFITIGFFVTPEDLWLSLPISLLIVGMFFVIKFSAVTFASILGGRHRTTALRMGFGMLALGEFSFIIAHTSLSSGLVDKPLLAIAVWVSFFTSILFPYIVRGRDSAISRITKEEPGKLQMYCNLTAGWFERLSSRMSGELRKAVRRFGLKMLVSVIIIVLVISAIKVIESFVQALAILIGLDPYHVWILTVLVALAILLIQAVIITRRIKNFIEKLSENIIRSSDSARAMGKSAIVHHFQNVVAISFAVSLMVLLSLYLPSFPIPLSFLGLGTLVLLVIIAWLMGDSLLYLNRRMERAFRSSFKKKKVTRLDHTKLSDRIREDPGRRRKRRIKGQGKVVRRIRRTK